MEREGSSSMRPAYLVLLTAQQYLCEPFPMIYLHHRGPDTILYCCSSIFFLLPLILNPLMTPQQTEFQHFAK